MIILSGKLLQVYSTPTGEDKDGKKYGGDTKIQVLHEVKLRNDETKLQVVELNVPSADEYKNMIGHNVELPVNVRAYKNTLYFEAI